MFQSLVLIILFEAQLFIFVCHGPLKLASWFVLLTKLLIFDNFFAFWHKTLQAELMHVLSRSGIDHVSDYRFFQWFRFHGLNIRVFMLQVFCYFDVFQWFRVKKYVFFFLKREKYLEFILLFPIELCIIFLCLFSPPATFLSLEPENLHFPIILI